MIKAVFFDIDGTLLDHKTMSIPKSTKLAIKKLKEKGILCGVATGRHQLEIKKVNLLEDLEFDVMVTLNGQYCYDSHGPLYTNPIDSQATKAIINLANKNNIPLIFIEENKLYATFINQDLQKAQDAIHTPVPSVENIPSTHNPYYQICAYGSKEKLEPFNHIPHVKTTNWHDLAIDILPENGNKTYGITQTLSRFNISLDETMAFGDGNNDVDMIQACKIGIAMKDSSQALLEACDHITDDVSEDGIYKALVHYKII